MRDALLTEVGLEFLQVFSLSLGIGLLMGLERERNPAARAGLRTFGLVALFGTVAALLGEKTGSPWMLAVGLLLVGVMTISAYVTHPDPQDPGTTTVVAVLLCFVYGAMVWHGFRIYAVMLSIVTTMLLYFKAELRLFSQKLTRKDLISILQFGVLSLVILPILPNSDMGPYDALNPAQLWWMVVLISGVSLAGYAALRIVGQHHGAPILGVLGGLASSTATTLVFSRHAASGTHLLRLATVVILLANLVVLVRLSIYGAVLQPTLLPILLPPLAIGLVLGAGFVVAIWRGLNSREDVPALELTNPAEIRTALTFGAVYGLVLVISAALSDYAGSKGLYLVAVVSGLTDVDAITLSSLRLYGLGKLSASDAVTAILIATLSNLVFKLGIVSMVGGALLTRRVAAGFGLIATGLVAGAVWFVLSGAAT
ncbi:MAG TPA: MgtC/SapB family protein [Rhodocyclaceae bacterium]